MQLSVSLCHLLQSHIAERRPELSCWEENTIKGLALAKEDMSHSHLTHLHMGEKARKQPLSTGVPAAKNTTNGVRAFRGQRPGMAGRNRGGPVVNLQRGEGSGHSRLLIIIAIIDLESYFSFLQSETNQDTKQKNRPRDTHDGSMVNLLIGREKPEKYSFLVCLKYGRNQGDGLPNPLCMAQV